MTFAPSHGTTVPRKVRATEPPFGGQLSPEYLEILNHLETRNQPACRQAGMSSSLRENGRNGNVNGNPPARGDGGGGGDRGEAVRFVVELVGIEGWGGDEMARLRRLLKSLRRAYGFRATAVRSGGASTGEGRQPTIRPRAILR